AKKRDEAGCNFPQVQKRVHHPLRFHPVHSARCFADENIATQCPFQRQVHHSKNGWKGPWSWRKMRHMTDDTQTVIFKRPVTSVEEMQQDWQELKLRMDRLEAERSGLEK